MALSWPDQYAPLQAILNDIWEVAGEIELLREFSDGRSGATVFEVDLRSRKHNGLAILKIGRPTPWPPGEAERHSRATTDNPDFADKHLPRLLDHFEDDEYAATLTSLAAGTLNYTEPLPRLGFQQQTEGLASVALGLLSDWNEAYSLSSPISPQECLVTWLGYRIQPESGGTIYDFLADDCQFDPLHTSILVEEHVLPNAYLYASERSSWPPDHVIRTARGRLHGDLHGGNIFLRIEPRRLSEYCLIDLALYESDASLFYDHSYLEISMLLNRPTSFSIRRWLNVLECLQSSSSLEQFQNELLTDDVGIIELCRVVRSQCVDWIHKQEHDREDHLTGQIYLSRIAAGLNFCNKPIGSHNRMLSFIYACYNLHLYFEAFKLERDLQDVAQLTTTHEVQPHTANWREVLQSMDNFDKNVNSYILISGCGVRNVDNAALETLSRMPWSAILDFDPGSSDAGLIQGMRRALEQRRAVQQALPDNVEDMNYETGTTWFMASGMSERIDTIATDSDEWRWQYVPAIRDLFLRMKRQLSPRSMVCMILASDIDHQRLRATCESIAEVFRDDVRFVLVDSPGSSWSDLEARRNTTRVDCTIADLLAGLYELYGPSSAELPVSVPMRSDPGNERGRRYLPAKTVQYLAEDLELVHPGLATEPRMDRAVGHDFWRGHEITWTEVDMAADVRRNIADQLRVQLTTMLAASRNTTINLEHTPGAGGTTLAKRLAWDLKDSYPTVRITRLSPTTPDRIQELTQLTKLPVLVVIEAAIVPASAREQLYKQLRGRNCRAVFLYVQRRFRPAGPFNLTDPMIRDDATRFFQRYRQLAPDYQLMALDSLVSNPDMMIYRSPFFFGFYAFLDEFKRIPDFVATRIADLTPEARVVMSFLALITRYSQSSLTEPELRMIAGISSPLPLHPEQIFGDNVTALILWRDAATRIVHPIIATEILRQILTKGNTTLTYDWSMELTDLCCDFIERLAGAGATNSRRLMELLTQLFITREPWSAAGERRRHFSELVLSINNHAGQHRVLRTLQESFPSEAHFWNHLGRHHLYVMQSSYVEAERCLLNAITLDEDNDIHHHALGMVYRREVKRLLDQMIRDRRDSISPLSAVQAMAEKAAEAFAAARRLDRETEYGYITNIQMNIEIVERLFRLSGLSSYAALLSGESDAARWCRELVPFTDDLLLQVKAIQAENNLSVLTETCEARLFGMCDQFDRMIQGLRNLLDRADSNKVSVRRNIAQMYYLHRMHSWSGMKPRELRQVKELMAENLDEAGESGRDLWMWFQSSRRLPDFDIVESIDRLTRWATRKESVEAYYYLYILEFLRYRQGATPDTRQIMSYIRRCGALAGDLSRIRSFEWLGREPQWCPLLNESELRPWNEATRFYENTSGLATAEGVVKRIQGAQAGELSLDGVDVFFVPAQDFLKGRDENRRVSFHLGFSYVGLRGWQVKALD